MTEAVSMQKSDVFSEYVERMKAKKEYFHKQKLFYETL